MRLTPPRDCGSCNGCANLILIIITNGLGHNCLFGDLRLPISKSTCPLEARKTLSDVFEVRARRHELVLCMLHVSACCLNRVLAPSLLQPMPSPNVRSLCLMLLICYVLPLHPALLATPVLAASSVRLRLIPHAPFCRLLSLSVLSPCCHRVSRSCPASALLPVCSSCLPLSSMLWAPCSSLPPLSPSPACRPALLTSAPVFQFA